MEQWSIFGKISGFQWILIKKNFLPNDSTFRSSSFRFYWSLFLSIEMESDSYWFYLLIWLSPDSLIWTKNKARIFRVYSAYFLQRELEEAFIGNTTSTSSSGRLHSFWNNIWSSLIPPKIKCFIWRACIDSLPICTKLFDRHISNSFSCVLYSDAAESCSHVLWECSFA